MSSSDRTRGSAPPLAAGPSTLRSGTPERQENAPATGSPSGQDPYGNWLDRMQRARARHAAITRNRESTPRTFAEGFSLFLASIDSMHQ